MNNLSWTTAVIIVFCCYFCSAEDKSGTPKNNIQEGKLELLKQGDANTANIKSVSSRLLDPSISEKEKLSQLLKLDFDEQDQWGPILEKVLSEAKSDQLQMLLLVKISNFTKWENTPSVLFQYAEDKANNQLARQIAINGLGNFSKELSSEPLIKLSEDKKENEDIRICALISLKSVDPTMHNVELEKIKSNEPNLFSTYNARYSSIQKKNGQKPQLLKAELENELRNKLLKADEKTAFEIIQALGQGKNEDTIALLIQRFNSESEKNKAEIALTLTKIAKGQPILIDKVKNFLVGKKANETSIHLKHAIGRCIDLLEGN